MLSIFNPIIVPVHSQRNCQKDGNICNQITPGTIYLPLLTHFQMFSAATARQLIKCTLTRVKFPAHSKSFHFLA